LTITEEETTKVKVDLQKPSINLGVPLIIVGCKADFFSRKWGHKSGGVGTEGDEKFDFLTRRLRKMCLDYGAALIYTSAVGRGANVEELQDYIYHRLYNIPLRNSAKVVGSNEDFNIYIPSGHDSLDLIATDRIQSKQGWTDDTPFEEVFKAPQKKRKEKLKDTKLLEAQPNDDFFRGLMEQLEKGPPTRSDGSQPKERKRVLDSAPTPTVVPTVAPVSTITKSKSGSSKKSAAGGSSAAAVAAAANSTDAKNNHVVKQFFRSLLTSQKGGPAVDNRGNRAKVQQMLKPQTEENSSGGTVEDPSRSLSPTRSPNTASDTSQG